MYLYLYDNFLNDNKYIKTLARMETRLTDLGIGGKISRLSPLKDLRELIKDEARSGVKTVVVVGGDKTVVEVVNEIADYNLTLGIIPIGEQNFIAPTLGIRSVEEACNIISARKVEKIDLGKAGGIYFIANLKIPVQKNMAAAKVALECEGRYQISPDTNSFEIQICNLRPAEAGAEKYNFSPKDGFLEAYIKPIAGRGRLFGWFRGQGQISASIVPFRRLNILAKNSVNIISDDQKVLKTPLEISVAPRKLRVIVGRGRRF